MKLKDEDYLTIYDMGADELMKHSKAELVAALTQYIGELYDVHHGHIEPEIKAGA